MKAVDLALVQACAITHAEGFCLFLPYGKKDEVLLLADIDGDDARHAYFIGDQHQFSAMEVKEGNVYKGIYLADIRIRVDVSAAYDPDRQDVIKGSLLIKGDKLFIGAQPMANNAFRDTYSMFLRHEEGITGPGVDAGFLRWAIDVGTAQEWTEVHAVDVSEAARSR